MLFPGAHPFILLSTQYSWIPDAMPQASLLLCNYPKSLYLLLL